MTDIFAPPVLTAHAREQKLRAALLRAGIKAAGVSVSEVVRRAGLTPKYGSAVVYGYRTAQPSLVKLERALDSLRAGA